MSDNNATKKDNSPDEPEGKDGAAPQVDNSDDDKRQKESGSPRPEGLDIDGIFPNENHEINAELFKELWNKRVEERLEFRKTNVNVSREAFEKLVKGKKLDSNLKKCTAFVRKMKQFVESQKTSVVADLNSLNLTKYQSEIAAVIVEGKFKPGEIPAILNVCSELHKRYSEFAELLLESFKKALRPKKVEVTPAVISKIASDIRLYSELLLGGIIPQPEGFQVLLTTAKNLIAVDKDGSQFVIPFSTLLKGIVDDLLGIFPKATRKVLERQDVWYLVKRTDFFTKKQKNEIKDAFQDYFITVSNNIEEKHEELLRSERYNRKLLVTKGEIPQDRMEAQAELSSKFEKYHSSASKLAVLLDLKMPFLKQLPPDPEDELEKALLTTEDGEILTEVPGIVLFDNEENRQFYQDYPDLKVYLPPVAYRDAIVQMQEKTKKLEELEKCLDEFDEATEQAELQEDKDIAEDAAVADIDGDLPPSMRENEEEKEPTDSKDSVIKPQKQAFSTYLDSLVNLVNKNMIDKAAIEFAECFNNKRHRRELVKRLFMVPRQRVDLLPLYSRLVAILSRVFPDIGIDLSTMLHKDFRYLVLKKDQIKIETKLKITRFIGELVNFSIFPKSEAFNCLKMLLRHFTHHQVEMTCAFMETCGRVLYRSTDSHRRMRIYLEEILRKKTVRNLEQRYVYMVDNAHYHICPPPSASVARKPKIPLCGFMEHVLWEDLNKSTMERAHKVLKMYDWKDPQKYLLVVNVLSAAWKYNYVQMESAAALLATIKKFRPSVTIAVVENLTEQVRTGLDYEFDDFNNVRMAASQYIAYIYTYKGLSTTTLFNVWYYLISYGVTYRDDVFTKMDPPDSLHRVRMISSMLRVCSDYLTSTNSRRRLNFFLKYFQRYYVYKRNLPCWSMLEFPFSVEDYYEETFRRIRYKWKFARTMEEAEMDIAEMDEQLRKKVKSDNVKTVMSNPMNCVTVKSQSGKGSRKSRRKLVEHSKQPSLDKIAEEPTDDADQLASEIETAQINDPYELFDADEHKDCDTGTVDDSDFLAAFEKMCLEANQMSANRSAPQSKTDIPVPMSTASRKTDDSTADGVVRVTLLTKKNNRQKLKTVEVPEDEDFLVNIRSREEAEKEEKQRMKSRTLAITRMQEEEERREQLQTVSQLVFNRSPTAPTSPFK